MPSGGFVADSSGQRYSREHPEVRREGVVWSIEGGYGKAIWGFMTMEDLSTGSLVPDSRRERGAARDL
jgi:hypothetical protein